MIDVPGTSLLPAGLMGIAYFAFMVWLFMGIAISADIFMEAIEVITSKTTIVSVWDQESNSMQQLETQVWNPTMANLTLMAFGSSAPEILLNVLEALKDLGEPAGDLGPSTIVGSAAFNLLVISGVSIYAVGEDVKKIDDMGVFGTTAIFSVFAYVWLYYCLSIESPGEVTTKEAYLTFGFFFILLILAFSADKVNQKKKKRENQEEFEKQKVMKYAKTQLRMMSRVRGEMAVIAAAQGNKQDNMQDKDLIQVQEHFKDAL
jgi:solute carrier family 8 (sodium/calcium exchanger)